MLKASDVRDPASDLPLVLFGGTFDPIHRAHVRAALAVSRALGNAPVRLLPNAVPPHRPQPQADGAQRLTMVRLAAAGHPALCADAWELSRPARSARQPSFTLATLRHYRSLIGPRRPLVFVVGADSFAGLDRWHRWREFAALCHLAVVPRPGAPAPSPAVQRAFPSAPPALLRQRPAGRRLMLRRPRLDVSATQVRDALAAGDTAPVNAPVLAYIRRQGLYTMAATKPDNEAP